MRPAPTLLDIILAMKTGQTVTIKGFTGFPRVLSMEDGSGARWNVTLILTSGDMKEVYFAE